MIDKLGLDGLGGVSIRKPKAADKLTVLVEAAKNSNSDDCNVSADALAGWGDDIIVLCSLLEKAEGALERISSINYAWVGVEALAAIKQWRQT